jgi:hypothetical protein
MPFGTIMVNYYKNHTKWKQDAEPLMWNWS